MSTQVNQKTHKWVSKGKGFNVVGQHIKADDTVGTSYSEFFKYGENMAVRITVKPSAKLIEKKGKNGKSHTVKTVIMDVEFLTKEQL